MNLVIQKISRSESIVDSQRIKLGIAFQCSVKLSSF